MKRLLFPIVAIAVMLVAACSTDTEALNRTPAADRPVPPAATPPVATPVADRRLEPAPIEKVSILMLKSYPAQYVLNITSGLPSGCAKFGHIRWVVEGDVVSVQVYNTIPASPVVACTLIYGYSTNSVNIGALTPGKTYTINVNDYTTMLTA
jgi:hypothetical protein